MSCTYLKGLLIYRHDPFPPPCLWLFPLLTLDEHATLPDSVGPLPREHPIAALSVP